MTHRFVLGTFRSEDDVLGVVKAVRARKLSLHDVYTPYAVHGLDEAMGLRPSRLTWVCFLAGAVGFGLTMLFQYYTSAFDWPLNVGGKPYNSLPAFIPIAFEATVLFAGMAVVIALFIRCGLYPGKKAKIPGPRVTNDRFVVVVRLDSADASAEDVQMLMEGFGVEAVDERVGGVA